VRLSLIHVLRKRATMFRLTDKSFCQVTLLGSSAMCSVAFASMAGSRQRSRRGFSSPRRNSLPLKRGSYEPVPVAVSEIQLDVRKR
jgi:hypothetical protein